ncbi:MAG TPA: MFS transporter [Cyanophyceae cyanobacterium]
MPKLLENVAPIHYSERAVPEFLEPIIESERMGAGEAALLPITSAALASSPQLDKQSIRSSLKASTLDAVFSTLFTCVTADVLLSNFLLELGASSVEIGLLSAMAMVANFLQPIGAYLADKATSRRWFSFKLFCPSRLLWLVLAIGIVGFGTQMTNARQLVQLTLALVLVTHVLGALGSPSWVSWMAALVPNRLRGRYFGLRNSAASLTNLVGIPVLGFVVSTWHGGPIQGYGAILILAVLAGLISLGFQCFMADINPQTSPGKSAKTSDVSLQPEAEATGTCLKDTNFLIFLLYYGLWMFAVNLSFPFFNVYMLIDLGLDVSQVTIYSSLTAGANLLMLVMWGKLADRIGNRPVLVLVGLVVAIIPLLWLGAGTDSLSICLWLPLLHLLGGGTWSAIDLCNNNLQMGIATSRQPSSYFAIAAAVSGLCGALGTMAGGVLAQFPVLGGLPGLFALSAVLRLVALLPLILVREPRSRAIATLLPRFSVIKRWNARVLS